MFSYQWDRQQQVMAVRERFERLGIPTWMDVDGGMQVNIYDSMAQGVSNAAVVIAFISQRYQDSENCKLELNFAKQNNVPIVPVKMQDHWKASEWLGVVTAGLLWTPMHDQTAVQQNVQAVIEQIKAAVPTVSVSSGRSPLRSASPTATVSSAEDSEEVLALRAELDSLRQDLSKQATQRLQLVAYRGCSYEGRL